MNHQLVPAQNVQLHSLICSSDGKALRVRGIQVHRAEEREIVELHAGEASLRITDSHRVMVQRNGQQETANAEVLQEGDEVLCLGGAHKLDVVRKYRRCIRVVEIIFDPDDPVEAFLLPPTTILTKGQLAAENRRDSGSSSTTASSGDADGGIIREEQGEQPVRKKKIRRGGMSRRGKNKHSAGKDEMDAEDIDVISVRTYDPYEA
jgi:hypothetical protein